MELKPFGMVPAFSIAGSVAPAVLPPPPANSLRLTFANDDSSSITKFLGKEAIRRRNGALEQLASRGGRHIERVEIVFQHNRDACNGPRTLPALRSASSARASTKALG